MNVIEIKLVDIEVGSRLREIDQDYVGLLAASMEENGQRTPIEVRTLKKGKRPYELIAGGHRLAALEEAGIETAFAVVLTVSDLQARLLEIDENLIRRELSALDRATFLAERKRVYEDLHPETKHGGDRRSDQVDNLGDLIAGRFSEATAERLGLSERVIQRAVARHQRLLPDVRSAIHATWIADSGSQLDALAKLTPEQQRAVADWIASGNGSLRTVADILRVIEQRPAPAPTTAYEKFLRLWRMADGQTRGQIRAFLATEGAVAQRSAA